MKRVLKLTAALVLSLTLCSCWDQQIFEKLGFILSTGVDMEENGNLLISNVYPIITQKKQKGGEEQEENKIEVVSSMTSLFRESRDDTRRRTPYSLVGGKVQNFIIGRKAAERGDILDYLEVFTRDIANPVQCWVLVVDGNANDMLNKSENYQNMPRISFYINQVLNANADSGYCPGQTMISYSIECLAPGLDPVLPLFSYDDKHITVKGTALIDGNHMSGELGYQDTACLMLAMGKQKKSELFLELPENMKGSKGKAAVFIKGLKRKMQVSIENGQVNTMFEIKLKLALDQYMWNSLNDEAIQSKLEESMVKNLQTRLQNVFEQLKIANCDAIGIGQAIKAKHYDFWKNIGGEEGWKRLYPTITANFKVTADIIRYGSIE